MAVFTGTVRSTQAEKVTDWFNYSTAADAPGFWSPTSACPAPPASVFDTGTPRPGDFVVHDG